MSYFRKPHKKPQNIGGKQLSKLSAFHWRTKLMPLGSNREALWDTCNRDFRENLDQYLLQWAGARSGRGGTETRVGWHCVQRSSSQSGSGTAAETEQLTYWLPSVWLTLFPQILPESSLCVSTINDIDSASTKETNTTRISWIRTMV